MAGDRQRDADKEKVAWKAGRVDTQHSGSLFFTTAADPHGPPLSPADAFGPPNNNERDSQLRERPNAGRRARKVQTKWDKPPAGQLRLIPAERRDNGRVC